MVVGDIVLSTDNEIFIKGCCKNQNMITYEKGAAPTQKINLENSVKTDLRGLGTGVGGFSNLATIMYAMIAQFDPETQKEQRAELTHRIKLLREIVGQEIDRIKGTAAPVVPKEWKKTERILPEDTDAEKAEKYKHNSMVINKKPYFFRYLYPELNKLYKQYESSYNQMCLTSFGLKLKQVLAKPNKTDAEKRICRLYYKYSPLITSSCTMNILCRVLEDADFDISFKRQNASMLPTFENEFTVDETKLAIIKSQYQKYNSSKQINILNRFFDYDESILVSQKQGDFKAVRFKIADSVRLDIRQSLAESNISAKELLFYSHELSKIYKKFNWAFVWDVLDAQVLEFIPQGTTKAPVNINSISIAEMRTNPQYDKTQMGEYLGQVYLLKDVSKNKWYSPELPDEDAVASALSVIDSSDMTPLTSDTLSDTVSDTISDTNAATDAEQTEPTGDSDFSDIWDTYLDQVESDTQEYDNSYSSNEDSGQSHNRHSRDLTFKQKDRDKKIRREDKWN